MNDAPAAAAAVPHDGLADRGTPNRPFVVIAGGGALLGALAGLVVAVPLAAAEGLAVFVATAIDVAVGLALIGGLIGANVAGTD
jgi:hypothetical protein